MDLMPLKAIGPCFLMLCLMISPPSHSANDDVLDKSYRLFTDLLVGDFDNQEQFYFDRRLELAESMQHRRNHVQVEATDDEGVFRLTQTLDEADKPARVQFLKVMPDYGSHRIQMTFHEAENLSDVAACTVHWRRQLNHFVADDVTGKCSENRNVNAVSCCSRRRSSRCSIWHYRRANGRKYRGQKPPTETTRPESSHAGCR